MKPWQSILNFRTIKQNLTLATIYCSNGNPNFTLFQTINNLSDNAMFVRDFNSKLESFGCARKTPLVQS